MCSSNWFLRLSRLDYGMTPKHTTLHSNVGWVAYQVDAIRAALEGNNIDDLIVELLGA